MWSRSLQTEPVLDQLVDLHVIVVPNVYAKLNLFSGSCLFVGHRNNTRTSYIEKQIDDQGGQGTTRLSKRRVHPHIKNGYKATQI